MSRSAYNTLETGGSLCIRDPKGPFGRVVGIGEPVWASRQSRDR